MSKATINDAPPTLPVPKAVKKASPKVKAVTSRHFGKVPTKGHLSQNKPLNVTHMAGSKSTRPPNPTMKVKTMAIVNGKYGGPAADGFDTVDDGITAVCKIIRARFGKGLREVIISFPKP